MKEKNVSIEEMEECVARFDNMKGASLAYLDQKIPGHAREIINLIDFRSMEANVIENIKNPDTLPHIKSPAFGFNLQFAHAEHGGGAALHSHETEEVFIPLIGPWSIYWMEDNSQRELVLNPFDVISVPTKIYRGFKYVGEERGTLLALIGGPDAGKIEWHPSVIEKARLTGLEIDKEGMLIEN